MVTYYVNGTIGADNTADSTNQATPTKTIGAALATASAAYSAGVVIDIEITDEGTYNEGDLGITKHGTTILHTASALGRPKLHGVGTAGSGPTRAFDLSNVTGTVFQGLEIHSYTSYVAYIGGSGGYPFTLSGCFVHSFIDSNNEYVSHNLKGTAANPNIIKDSVLYFPSNAKEAGTIRVDGGHLHIKNSFITASHDGRIVQDYGAANVTCSFSTFINRHPSTTYTQLRVSKVINCIVSGSGAGCRGIASDDHTYNLVDTRGAPWRNHADGSDGGAGTGDLSGADIVGFVDGTAIGSTTAVAPNYRLQSDSSAVGAGTDFDGTTKDISGSLRNQGGKNWSSYSTPPKSDFAGDLTINRYANAASQYKRGPEITAPGYSMGCFAQEGSSDYDGTMMDQVAEQVPFSLATRGPSAMRQRSIPYCVSKGGNPATIILTGSS